MREDRQSNGWDRYAPDVDALLKVQDLQRAPLGAVPWASADGYDLATRCRGLLRFAADAAVFKSGLHRSLVIASLRNGWFREFRTYWCDVLGNRPIELPEFHYLAGSYRSRFADLELPAGATSADHLSAWRDPRVVHSLFYYVFRTALEPFAVHPFLRFFPKAAQICEYGCGVAPITFSLSRYYRHLDFRATVSDIPTLLFHFVRWRFRDAPYVLPLTIDPADDEPLGQDYDVVFCSTVFEHLPRPLAIARHIFSRLKPRGFLIFDYVQSEAHGLDSEGGLRERGDTLRFIAENFVVRRGDLRVDGDVGTVVCQRK